VVVGGGGGGVIMDLLDFLRLFCRNIVINSFFFFFLALRLPNFSLGTSRGTVVVVVVSLWIVVRMHT
jgi:hypothetical protein